MKEKKNIYIVLSKTGTVVSRMIRLYTRDEYNHASICLDDNLEKMYSFGRRHAYNPVWAGFVEESPHFGTFKRFNKTKVAVIKIKVDIDVYNRIKDYLEEMMRNRDNYHYNYLGLFLAAFGIAYSRENCYYCSEFVEHILEAFSIQQQKQCGKNVVTPMQLMDINGGQVIYRGMLNSYNNVAG